MSEWYAIGQKSKLYKRICRAWNIKCWFQSSSVIIAVNLEKFKRSRHASRHVRYARAVMHVGIEQDVVRFKLAGLIDCPVSFVYQTENIDNLWDSKCITHYWFGCILQVTNNEFGCRSFRHEIEIHYLLCIYLYVCFFSNRLRTYSIRYCWQTNIRMLIYWRKCIEGWVTKLTLD